MKNKYLSLLGTITAIAPIALVVSCSENKAAQQTQPTQDSGHNHHHHHGSTGGTVEPYKQRTINNDFSSIWNTASKTVYFDATIDHWIDGDTVSFTPKDQHGIDIAQNHLSLRIQNIDSPEVNHNFAGSTHVEDKELVWGDKSTDLAKRIIPHGTTVRIWTNGIFSYNRIVGSIFYGDHFKKNYAIEQLAAGLSQPFYATSSLLNPVNVNSFMGEELTNAFNNGYYGKQGMFSLTMDELRDTMSAHGLTSWSHLLWENKNEPGNIYKAIEAKRSTK